MSKTYSIAQVRDHLSEVVHQAEAGGEIVLTRRGKPVAILLSQRRYAQLRGESSEFWNVYQQFRVQVDLESLGIEENIFTDVRDKVPGRDVKL